MPRSESPSSWSISGGEQASVLKTRHKEPDLRKISGADSFRFASAFNACGVHFFSPSSGESDPMMISGSGCAHAFVSWARSSSWSTVPPPDRKSLTSPFSGSPGNSTTFTLAATP